MGSIAQQSPVPRGGASLIVAWSIASRHILVVGGSDAAASRVFFALEADAQVHVVAPKTSLSPALIGHIDRREVTYYDREFEQRDLHDKSMVFVASEDASLAKHIAALCRMGRIPVNIADQPDLSDFWLTSTYRDHALQIAVSTNGNGPKIATRLRKHIAATLPEGSGLAIQRLGVLRQKLRAADPSDKSASRRLAFINKLSEAWPLQKLAELTNGEIDQLVQIYLAG
ncbi:putative siroheme synthase Met8, partial [Polychytrium aggregatum]|uniref:putative siroheme synthase Met8 n=1 Tax=Polychytrium aggregatum TaxID=110093 RepID=UPI0022FE0B95